MEGIGSVRLVAPLRPLRRTGQTLQIDLGWVCHQRFSGAETPSFRAGMSPSAVPRIA